MDKKSTNYSCIVIYTRGCKVKPTEEMIVIKCSINWCIYRGEVWKDWSASGYIMQGC